MSQLEDALQYYKNNWYPIPLCWPDEFGHCACPRKHKNIKEIGKAPLLGKGFTNKKPREIDIRNWWTRWPRANIGVLLEPSGLLLVDLDGPAAIKEAVELNLLKPGPIATSGRTEGGEHHYYKRPADIPITNLNKRGKSKGIDIKTAGYGVVPPSTHREKNQYTWRVKPEQLTLQYPSIWVVEQFSKNNRGSSIGWSNKLPQVELEQVDIPENIKMLIREGQAVSPDKYSSRSEAVFATITHLLQHGVTDDQIAAILLDQRFKISEKPLEKGFKWVQADIQRAKNKYTFPKEREVNTQEPSTMTREETQRIIQSLLKAAQEGEVGSVYDQAKFLARVPKAEYAKAEVQLKEVLGTKLNLNTLKGLVRDERQRIEREQRQSVADIRHIITGVRAGIYKVKDQCIYREKDTRDGIVEVPLCNFNAHIVTEEIHDDGIETQLYFQIKGVLHSGLVLPDVEVSAEQYPAMNWITENWGTRAVYYAGQGTKDHLRVAIQTLSGEVPRKTVYAHLGWRFIDGKWIFLHAGGGIGQKGVAHDIYVDYQNGLKSYALPEPIVKDHERVSVIQQSLELLKLAPKHLMYPLLAAVFRAPLGEAKGIDFALFYVGQTGSQKTELTALAQAHFGGEFNGKNLPGNWATTANFLEKQSFQAKDVIFTVDDFAPTGSTTDVQRYHREADRLFRAQGNRSGRGRMKADGKLRPTYFPRGLIISSGEDIPKGHSIRARMLILEVERGDVDLQRLTEAQTRAAANIYAKTMASYLQWLAPRMEDLKKKFNDYLQALRNRASQFAKDHARTPDIMANLMAGWECFLQFALASGAITSKEREYYTDECWHMLRKLSQSQAQHHQHEEPTQVFLSLLQAVLVAGRGHLAPVKTDHSFNIDDDATNYGWRFEQSEWHPKGELIGWIEDDDVYLEGEAAFASVQKLARDQGSHLSITQRTLWKRMKENNLLASTDENQNTVRKTIAGSRKRVIHIKIALLFNTSSPSSPADPVPGQQKED